MSTHFKIGIRQTVDRARHPALGEGRAVYDNGPCAFIADSGEVLRLQSCGLGGWAQDRGPWLVATTEEGDRVELEKRGLQAGATHRRIMAYDKIRGWLVTMPHPIGEPNPGFTRCTFMRDDGENVRMFWHAVHVGLPGTMKRMKRNGYKEKPFELYWNTLTLCEGKGHFTYCLEDYADKVQWPAPKGVCARTLQLPGVP